MIEGDFYFYIFRSLYIYFLGKGMQKCSELYGTGVIIISGFVTKSCTFLFTHSLSPLITSQLQSRQIMWHENEGRVAVIL